MDISKAPQQVSPVRFREHIYLRWKDGADAEPDR
jgi:hypothetical protein